MPVVETTPVGAPCWIDLATSDPDRARDFYGQVFGWTVVDPGPDFGGYVNFAKGGRLVGGMMRQQVPGVPDTWTTYFCSADAKATVDAARNAGGQVMVEAMDVADLGTMAVVIDPAGAGVGIWQPGKHHGFGIVAEAGAPVWHELHTRDYSAALSFYPKVFGARAETMSDTDDFRYTQLFAGPGELPVAGIMDASRWADDPDAALGWSCYLGAEDVDATLATVERAGGRVLEPAMDTPYGRLARAADPMGATFKLGSLTD